MSKYKLNVKKFNVGKTEKIQLKMKSSSHRKKYNILRFLYAYSGLAKIQI